MDTYKNKKQVKFCVWNRSNTQKFCVCDLFLEPFLVGAWKNMEGVARGNQTGGTEEWFTVFETVLLSTAMLCGIFGNLLTIITVTMSKQIRTVPNVYVTSLSVANLFLSAIATPFFVVTIWRNQNNLMEPDGCAVMGYTTLVILTVTLYNHAAISVNRFIMVTKSKKTYMDLYQPCRVWVSLVLIWAIPGLIFTAPFFGLGTYGYDTHRKMCLFQEEEYKEKTYWYIVASDMVGPVLVFLITMVCHLKIMRHFKKSRKRIVTIKSGVGTTDDNSSNTGLYTYPYMGSTGQLTALPHSTTMGGLNPAAQLVNRQQKQQQQSASVVKNLVLPWMFLLLLRLPLVVVHFIDRDERVPSVFHHIGLMIVFLNPVADFVIYALLNRQMRQYFKAILNCRSPNTIRYIPHWVRLCTKK